MIGDIPQLWSASGAEKDQIRWRRYCNHPSTSSKLDKNMGLQHQEKSDNCCGQFCPLYPVLLISDLSLSLSHDVWSSHKMQENSGNPSQGYPKNASKCQKETQYHCGVLKLGYPKSSSRHKIWPNQKKLNAMVTWESPRLKKLPFFRVPFLCG